MRSIRRLTVLTVGSVIGGICLFGCGGPSQPSASHPVDAAGGHSLSSKVVSSSSGSTSGTATGCAPSGSTHTYQLSGLSAWKPFIQAHPDASAVYTTAYTNLFDYAQHAWPSGTLSGLASVDSIDAWLHFVDASSPSASALSAGPTSISYWEGGAPNAAQAASVAFDARFLFYVGVPPGTTVPQPWGTATLVGERMIVAGLQPGTSISYNSRGQIVGICLPWWVEVGRQAGSSFTWWYIHGVAAMVPSYGTWLIESPAATGWVYDEPGNPGSEPPWISASGTPGLPATVAPPPAGAASMNV